jgi:hypothetical protein
MTTNIPVAKRDNVQRFVDDDVVLSGEVGDHTIIAIRATGTITVSGVIHGHSQVLLVAGKDVSLLGDDSQWHFTVDDQSSLTVRAGGMVETAGHLNNCTADIAAGGTVVMGGNVDGGSRVRVTAGSDVTVHGKVDGTSRLEVVSQTGSVALDGKIDKESDVHLAAGVDAEIGADHKLDAEDRKVDGNSVVTVTARRDIRTGRLGKDHTFVDLVAGGTIAVDKVDSRVTVRMLAAGGSISIPGGVHDGGTHVTSMPTGAVGSVSFHDGTAPVEMDWGAEAASVTPATDRVGYWWENWSQTFGYVAPFRHVPRTLEDLVKAVQGSGNVDRPDTTPVKAVGGGWSFSDASLPLTTGAEVDRASLVLHGRWQQVDVRSLLEGRSPEGGGTDAVREPMDLHPQRVVRTKDLLSTYDQKALRRGYPSGSQLPASTDEVRLVDTRALASSLQCEFRHIRAHADVAGVPVDRKERLFHVEAGITMADLQQLLDHQNPRLAIRASGGSPGATLAGALSTATHGGECGPGWELLVDSVRAVHLVGPGGVQWWIEGDEAVANQTELQKRYNGIRFVGKGWAGISGLTSEDVLRAVVVSMGTMGVIYSVVLAVYEQFGLRQVVQHVGPDHAGHDGWQVLLGRAKVSEADLRNNVTSANTDVLGMLLDGTKNGTGIAAADNVYVDLAINPLDRQCWVVNRSLTKDLPDDPNNAPTLPGAGFLDVISRALAGDAKQADLRDDRSLARIFDFLSWGRSDFDMINNAGQAARLVRQPTSQPDPLTALLALASAQAVLNMRNRPSQPATGLAFGADVLTGFFHALQGTAPDGMSDQTGVSYRIGAIGWPDTGLAGRGLEVSLDPQVAFSFVQQVLFDKVRAVSMVQPPSPLLGYISIRVCPKTRTLMGMQQFGDHSVMVEVVGYRSPQANDLMNEIQDAAIAFQPLPAVSKPLLHWGLENHRLAAADLPATPLGQPYAGAMTRLDAFRAIRAFLRGNAPPVFDNFFTQRLGI